MLSILQLFLSWEFLRLPPSAFLAPASSRTQVVHHSDRATRRTSLRVVVDGVGIHILSRAPLGAASVGTSRGLYLDCGASYFP